MKLLPLIWDSEFFGMNISKLETGTHSIRIADLDLSNVDLVYVFSQIKQEALENEGAFLADTKITYAKNVINTRKEHFFGVESYNGIITDEILNLGISSGWASRFNIDPKLNSKFKDLYKLWVINSIERKIADDVLVVNENGHCIAIVTLKQNDSVGKIGIIAVDEKYRGKQIGKKLLENCDIWYSNRNIETAEVVTQKLNEGACRFYEQNDYKIKSTEYVYHLWNLK